MEAYNEFKQSIDEIKDQLDTFLFILDYKKTSNPDETIGGLIEAYSNIGDWLKQTMQNFAKAKGDILLKDIDYKGKFSKSEMNEKLNITAIDSLYGIINQVNNDFLYDVFAKELDSNQMHNLIDYWEKSKRDFFEFYTSIGIGTGMQLQILQALHLDKDIKTINSYTSFCNFSTPIILKDVSDCAWQTVIENNIDHYGRWQSWLDFWLNATPQGKQDFLNYIKEAEKENMKIEW